MAQVALTLHVRRRWFFWPALVIATVIGRLGLIRDIDEGRGAVIKPHERAARWLAEHAFRYEVR